MYEEFKPAGKRISKEEREMLAKDNLKWCSKCETVKPLDDFSNSKQRADGKVGQCKECVKAKYREKSEERLAKAKEYYQNNREDKLDKAAEYRANNSDKIKESRKKYYESNKDSILKKNDEYRQENLDSISAQQKEYRKANIEKKSAQEKEWRKNNKERIRARQNYRYEHDEKFKIKHLCRQMVRRAILSIGSSKDEETRKFLGYSAKDLKEHLEKQFQPGMSWENHGKWHVDHIIPISRAETLEEAKVLSQLSNLQPLWAEDNLSKGVK